MRLSPKALSNLRDIVHEVRDLSGETVPHDQIVRLGSEPELRSGVTIDFEASEAIGVPIVVLHSPSDPRLALLSERESQVAGLVAEGLTNKEIARRLGISIGTTKDHVHRILEKTGFPNRAAIAAAIRV